MLRAMDCRRLYASAASSSMQLVACHAAHVSLITLALAPRRPFLHVVVNLPEVCFLTFYASVTEVILLTFFARLDYAPLSIGLSFAGVCVVMGSWIAVAAAEKQWGRYQFVMQIILASLYTLLLVGIAAGMYQAMAAISNIMEWIDAHSKPRDHIMRLRGTISGSNRSSLKQEAFNTQQGYGSMANEPTNSGTALLRGPLQSSAGGYGTSGLANNISP